MSKFKTFRVNQSENIIKGSIEELSFDDLDAGDVVIDVQYSSVNYKDALAATGAGQIIRKFPRVGGIDLAGIVRSSEDPSFKAGDEVLATSYGIGVDHDGGYSPVARIPSKWVIPIPFGMTIYESMCLGTAGLTAGMAVSRIESVGVTIESGPVVVTGATGGVGSIAIDILSKRGYKVSAISGKESEKEYLLRLGASEVINRHELDLKNKRPLNQEKWAAGIDNLGGDVLSLVTSEMRWGGALAVIGLAASASFNTTVLPFILRNINVLGIDSVQAPLGYRKKIWNLLATKYKPKNIDQTVTVIKLGDLPVVFDQMINGKIRGRYVVQMSE